MAKNEQFEILLQVLRHFQEAGILQDLMLIGSWCLQFYRYHFQHPETLPAFRTMDVDFLIPHASKIKREVDIPTILRKEGFAATFNRSSGIVKYNHKELQVEFLVPELGKGGDIAREIKNLHIKAVALRYLNMLPNYPLLINYEGLQIRVPEPGVLALHKLIISQRRKNKEKQRTDLEMATGLLKFLFERPREADRVKAILDALPLKWRKSISEVSQKHFPALSQWHSPLDIKPNALDL